MKEDAPIIVRENGHDYEVRVFFGTRGVRVSALDETRAEIDLPRISSDQARELARRLIVAADELDAL